MYIYLEYSHEKSHKFYELKVEETTISVTFGRIGTQGQTKCYLFTTKSQKEKFYTKLLIKKAKRGYVEAVKGQRWFKPSRNMNPKQLQIPFIES